MKTTVKPPTNPLYPIFKRVGSDPRKYRVGFMNNEGVQVLEPIFDNARPFRCGLASVKRQNKWGAINGQGRLAIGHISDIPLRISEDRAIYEVDGKRGVTDLTGQIILKPKYRSIGEFHEGLAWMSSSGLYGFISHNCEQLIAPFYEDARSFSDGVAPVKLGGKWGFINRGLKPEIALQFDFALPFSEGLARVKQGSSWGYIDRKGEYTIIPQFEEAREFHEGLAEVKIAGQWGYINSVGDVIVKPAYGYAGQFTEGLAAVEPYHHPNKHIGFIDRNGTYVIPPQYEMVGSFRQGLCFVELAEEIAYIDHNGSIIWRGPFVDVGRTSEL